MVVYIIISLFAFYGFFHLSRYRCKDKNWLQAGGRKAVPCSANRDEKLEGRIRCIFLEEIPEKLGTDSYSVH